MSEVEETNEDAGGLPENMREKRRGYTMSPEALEARRRNAQQSTGPTSADGKKTSSRNSWKHGLYASSRVLQFAKPCLKTCTKFPCSIVDDGTTQPGGDCLDKEHMVEAVMAIERAIKDGQYDELNELVAFELGETLQMIRQLRTAVMDDGVLVKHHKLDKDGKVIGYEYKLHPALLALPKLLSDFGLTLTDFRLTPKERQRSEDVQDGAKTMADLLAIAALKGRDAERMARDRKGEQ